MSARVIRWTRAAFGMSTLLVAVPIMLAGHPAAASLTGHIALTHDIFEPGIEVTPYDAATHPNYSTLLERPDWLPTAQYAVVISNDTDHAVDGLVVRWRITDASLRPRWQTLQIDSYSRASRTPAVRARSSVVVTPSGIISRELLATRFVTAAMLGSRTLTTLSRRATTPVELDSVILDDGRVLGADAFRIADYLRARQTAALRLAEDLRSLPDQQNDLLRALAPYAAIPSGANSLDVDRWLFVLSTTLSRSSNRDELLNRLTELPPLFK